MKAARHNVFNFVKKTNIDFARVIQELAKLSPVVGHVLFSDGASLEKKKETHDCLRRILDACKAFGNCCAHGNTKTAAGYGNPSRLTKIRIPRQASENGACNQEAYNGQTD